MPLDSEIIGKIVLAVYCLIGLPVVWLHMRQQGMHGSVQQVQDATSRLVVYTLAVLWPVLLLSMVLNHLQRRTASRSSPKREDGDHSQ
jgi:fumarate reductase subunit D